MLKNMLLQDSHHLFHMGKNVPRPIQHEVSTNKQPFLCQQHVQYLSYMYIYKKQTLPTCSKVQPPWPPPPNKKSKHPTPPTLALRLFLQSVWSSKRKTRLAGHLVWKALTHAKGKHTEPNQQLSGEEAVVFLSLFWVLRKKRNPNKQQV